MIWVTYVILLKMDDHKQNHHSLTPQLLHCPVWEMLPLPKSLYQALAKNQAAQSIMVHLELLLRLFPCLLYQALAKTGTILLILFFLCIPSSFLLSKSNEQLTRMPSFQYAGSSPRNKKVEKKKSDPSSSNAPGMSHCSKSSFFVQRFNFEFPRKLSIFWVENSWKYCVLRLFSCWQLWFHEKNCQQNLGEKLVKMLGFCFEFLDKKFEFSNSVYVLIQNLLIIHMYRKYVM